MYEAHFGLTRRPFAMTADPEFLFWSESHALALSMLRYGVTSRSPVTLLTGGVGTGKTTLLRALLGELDGEIRVGLVNNVQEGRGDLLDWILLAMDEPTQEAAYVARLRHFQDRLIEVYGEGARTLLVFDEAQNLGPASLEELRMLSNINADGDELLQIVLVGQPGLRETLSRPEMAQLLQRVGADFHLESLSPEDVEAYLARRLELAGARAPIFTEGAARAIAGATGGIPRLVNSLADLALVHCASHGRREVSADSVTGLLDTLHGSGIFTQFAPAARRPAVVAGRG